MVALPTLVTLELSSHQSLLWLTAQPRIPGSIPVLRKNSPPEGLLWSPPLDLCLWAWLQGILLGGPRLPAASGLEQRGLVRFPGSFDFHTTIVKGSFCPCPGVVLIPWPQSPSPPVEDVKSFIPPPAKWLITPLCSGWHLPFSPYSSEMSFY